MKTKSRISKNRPVRVVRNSCGGQGCFIKLRVLPYGSPTRRRSGISKTVNA